MSNGSVWPGAFCTPVGATGTTASGTDMVCRINPINPPADGRARWGAINPAPKGSRSRKRRIRPGIERRYLNKYAPTLATPEAPLPQQLVEQLNARQTDALLRAADQPAGGTKPRKTDLVKLAQAGLLDEGGRTTARGRDTLARLGHAVTDQPDRAAHATYISGPDGAGQFGFRCAVGDAEASGYETVAGALTAATAHGPLAANAAIPAEVNPDDNWGWSMHARSDPRHIQAAGTVNLPDAEAMQRFVAAKMADHDWVELMNRSTGRIVKFGDNGDGTGTAAVVREHRDGPALSPSASLHGWPTAQPTGDGAAAAGTDWSQYDPCAKCPAGAGSPCHDLRTPGSLKATPHVGRMQADMLPETKKALAEVYANPTLNIVGQAKDEFVGERVRIESTDNFGRPEIVEGVLEDVELPTGRHNPWAGKPTAKVRIRGRQHSVSISPHAQVTVLDAVPADRSADSGTDWSEYGECDLCGQPAGVPCRDMGSPGSLNATPHYGRPVVTAAQEQPSTDPLPPTSEEPQTVIDEIRRAYADNYRLTGDEWYSLTALREDVSHRSRADVDAALTELVETADDVNLIPESRQWELRPQDRKAALNIGSQDKHHLSIDQPVARLNRQLRAEGSSSAS